MTGALQWRAGAYTAGFGSYPDEPAHYVTGLMLHDYVAAWFPQQPLAYAKNYYLHYPAIAIGYWPPFFYVAEAAWMLVFGVSRTSVLAMAALISALFQFTIFRRTAEDFGTFAGVAAGTLFGLLPVVQWSNDMVMTDMLVALLSFWAVLLFGRYLDSLDCWHAIGFGVVSSLAILTKASGFYLALVPPLAIMATRRFHVLRKWPTWAAAAIVVVLCGPWFLLTRHMTTVGLIKNPNETFAGSIVRVASELRDVSGWALPALAVFGVVAIFRRMPGRWAAMVAQPFAVLLFLAAAPVGAEWRYLILAAPAVIVLAFAGIAWLVRQLPRLPQRAAAWAGIAACCAATLATAAPARYLLFGDDAGQAVADVMRSPALEHGAILLSSETSREGRM
ncbi:MAG: glycosyltransferase family 39 protein, partial [Acidobacteria bacterium]|nr:glycosyltransferase family 39 protein [Acidobacteriota bacterium]